MKKLMTLLTAIWSSWTVPGPATSWPDAWSPTGQTKGTTVTGSTVVAPADVAAVAVQNIEGREFVLASA